MRLNDASPRTWLLATVAGWALLTWVLALAGMGRSVDALAEDPSLVKPLPQVRKSPADTLGALAQYSEIASRPLFVDDRRPKPFFMQGKGEGENQAAAFDYLLTSVILTPQLSMAFLQPADGSESVRVKLGEVPESHPAWRLTSLQPRHAVFEGPEGRRELDLRVFNGQGGEPPTASTSAPPGAVGPQPVGRPIPSIPPPPMPNRSPQVSQVPPQPTPQPQPASTEASAPLTEQAQMEAIRKRIEARRAQLRQQQAAQPPANTP
ncbi:MULTISPECIES: general secretion pathway protein GspN [unclassified Lysobacter]|uniref:general secretion pathway protein GspN n=1 Tax=unclassified Lysobacter TaxID=2635362 RepID=UPI001BE9AF2A|nr:MULTISPECIES: general secretion pathway protein GspN [unclassified Lysobacter]MBT2747861.1 general secretion pathway protein GspN [Lysobacter sp. ISL-42]MBT2753799.1 general secretion pathway protein GspN [Lysobacter sp. ISL-50]MBT2779087.1 general secretion pathway protein GspN [Lysobacter sp. ISL-54]